MAKLKKYLFQHMDVAKQSRVLGPDTAWELVS